MELHTREINAAVCVIWSYREWWWRNVYCKSRSVEEDAPVCRWEYWPYWFGVGGDREGLCIAGSSLAVRRTIPVSTAGGWTLVMFMWLGFIVLAYTNNGLFPPTCEEVWNGWLYTGRGWLEKLLDFQCLIFAINWRTPIWNSSVSSSLKFWRDWRMTRVDLAGFLLPVLSLFLAQIHLDYAFAFHTAVFVVFGKEFLGRNYSYHLYFVQL